MRIVFAAGGTLGSVSPLISVSQELHTSGEVECRWLGTRGGPEHEFLAAAGFTVQPITASKLRRYLDWRNCFLVFPLAWGVLQAFRYLGRFRPDAVVSAGSYVALPVALAAWLRRIPITVHQQDVHPSLTNRLLAPLASAISVSFPQSVDDFPRGKTVLTGNPVRRDLQPADLGSARRFFQLDPQVPTLLVLGGGTGAAALNRLVWDSLQQLLNCCQVVHCTGRGKMTVIAEHPRYRAFEFLGPELGTAYAAADLVVCRAGMGTLTELTQLAKPALLIPLPGTHQELNAAAFARQNAALLIAQPGLTPADFTANVCGTLADPPQLANLSRNIATMLPANAAAAVANVIRQVALG